MQINNDWQILKPGDKVLCINDEYTYVEGNGQLLRAGNEYVVERQTFAKYVWVKGVNAPYLPDRFVLL